MKSSTSALLCILLSVSVSGRPQDGYSSGGASSSAAQAPAPAAPAPAAPSGGITATSFVAAPAVQASYQVSSSGSSSSSAAAAPAPAPAAPSSFSSAPAPAAFQEGGPGGSSSSSSSGGGSLSTDCQRQELGDGKFKFVCSGVNPDSISLRSEHILWLTQDGGQSQVVDIEVPNYKINELIKAGFKPGSAGDQTINVLLKKPEQTVDAQVDKPSASASKPNVKLQYEPVQKQLIHFPNDKQYSPLSGPILPPLAGGRAQRQVNSFQQQQQQQLPGGFQVQPQLNQRFIHQFDQPIYSASSYATGRN